MSARIRIPASCNFPAGSLHLSRPPAALSAIDRIDGWRAANYNDIIFAVLSKAAWKELEMVMTGKNHLMSDWARSHFAAGEARAILAILAVRGITVTEPTRERITTCSDLDQLDRWLQIAALATSDQEFETALVA